MNKEITLTVWEDDLPEEIMERLAGTLCELGIIINQVSTGTDDEFVTKTYRFDLAPPLPEDGNYIISH